MADSEKSNILNSTMSASALKEIKERTDTSNNKLQKNVLGFDKENTDLFNKQSKVMSELDKRINSLLKGVLGSGSKTKNNESSTDIDAMLALSNKNFTGQSKKKGIDRKAKEALENAQKEILELNKSFLEGMLASNKKNYQENLGTYNLIMKIIPKMRLVMKTFVNTIISPDDFTKNSLNLDLIEEHLEEDSLDEIRERFKDLIDKYGLDAKLSEDVTTYLRDGKLFFIVKSMNDEIKQMLTESTDLTLDSYKTLKLKSLNANETQNLLVEDANLANVNATSKYLIENVKEVFNVPNNSSAVKAIENIDSYINENFLIGDINNLLHDSKILTEEVSGLGDFFKTSLSGNSDQNTVPAKGKSKISPEEIKYINNSKIDGKDSAICKKVSAGNIVPLEFEGNILGYIYLDIVEVDPDGTVIPSDKTDSANSNGASAFLGSSNTIGSGNALQNMIYSGVEEPSSFSSNKGKINAENPNGTPSLNAVDDARLMFISKTFTNQLSAKTNLKLLRKSSTLKRAIYNSLCIKKIQSSEKIRIVYLKPEEVVYIDRGQSIFDNVLFFAKLYIASLITLLMQNVLRGAPKRVTYVEVGLDNNPANSVTQVIRDMRSKEISAVHNMDIQSLLNVIGEYQDLYIPVVDGEKPISFDQLDAQEAQSLDNDFLNWLSNNIFSSMLPASYLTEVDNVDFAKSLSMQNSRFLRDIVADQRILSSGYTTLIRRLYELNYGDELKDKDENSKNSEVNSIENISDTSNFELTNVSILFPSPSSLNLTNLTDQISNASSVVETITENLKFDGIDEADNDTFKSKIKVTLMAKYAPLMDWAGLQELVDREKREFIKTNIRKNLAKPTDDAASSDTAEDPF